MYGETTCNEFEYAVIRRACVVQSYYMHVL